MTTNYEDRGTLAPTSSLPRTVRQGHRRPLPAAIAIASDHALLLQGVPLGARNVLAEIARHLKRAAPFATVFPAKETIAARIGITARSVYRHLNILEDSGLIVREPQRHRQGTGKGEFLTGHIKLTPLGATCLGLVAAPSPALDTRASMPTAFTLADSPTTHQSVATTPPEAAIDANTPVLVHSEPSDKMSGHYKALTEPKLSALKRTAPTPARAMATVPAELTWLLRYGLRPGDIFFLMGQATQHRHRLSDIVTSKKILLFERQLTGRNLKAFLLTLARSAICFKTLAQRAQAAERHAVDAARYAQQAGLFRARFANTQLASRDLTRLYEIDAECRFMRTWDGTVWRTTPLTDLRSTMRALERGDLVLATKAIAQQLQQATAAPCPAHPRPPKAVRSVCLATVPTMPHAAQFASTPSRTHSHRANTLLSREAVHTMRAMLNARKVPHANRA